MDILLEILIPIMVLIWGLILIIIGLFGLKKKEIFPLQDVAYPDSIIKNEKPKTYWGVVIVYLILGMIMTFLGVYYLIFKSFPFS